MAESTYTIFYSWQSDLPSGNTRGLIEESIEAAAKSLKNIATVHADRDTLGEFGSPDIVQTILAKIDECDIFVADVSSVATYHPFERCEESSSENKPRRLKATPNANVMLELGYATQVVGWENIICIMNDDYNCEGEIPFDIEHHRLTHFSLKNRTKADVRKELRDIIASTVMNVMENGKKVRPQFSNILVGCWNQEERTVVKSLLPYNVCESESGKMMRNTLLDTARILLENIQSAKIRSANLDELPALRENELDENCVPNEKIIAEDGSELIPIPNQSLLDLFRWNLVVISKEERSETIEDIKTYFSVDVNEEFFDFGGLKRRIYPLPGFDSEYDGTDEEKRKYYDYVELRATIGRIQMLELYRKTFDGVVLIPLAAKNDSTVSDSDVHISLEIDESTAEVIYPTAEFICDDLKGIEGHVYEEGFVELTLAQNTSLDIKSTIDDRFWSIEDQQSTMNAMIQGGINGQPRYSAEDYSRELSRYIASPEEGKRAMFEFCISSIHAKEAKWLPRMIALRPLKETIQMKYSVKSRNSDGDLEGNLEFKV